MSSRWDPHEFTDSFKDEILALVDDKVKAGQLHTVLSSAGAAPEKTPIPFGAQILNLTDLLQRSLRSNTVSDSPLGIERQRTKTRTKALPAKKLAAPDGLGDGRPDAPIKRRAA